MDLNSAIKKYLNESGIKQYYIAEKCHWTPQKTSCIINGKQKITADDMWKICKALDLPYDYFYAVRGM